MKMTENHIIMFTEGRCMDFAIELNKVSGWPIWAEFFPDYGGMIDNLWHAWCLNDKNKAVDIQGIHKGRRPKFDKFGGPTKIRLVTKYDIRLHTSGSDWHRYGRKVAKKIITANLPFFGMEAATY